MSDRSLRSGLTITCIYKYSNICICKLLDRMERAMPLVRIDLQKGKDASYRRKAGQIVYEAMVATSGVPKNDHFQIVGEHSAENFVFDSDYLGIHRTSDLIMIQIFF